MFTRTLKAPLVALALGSCLVAASAHAADYSIYGQAGLFGIGGGIGIGFNDTFQARVGYGAFNYSFDDVEVDDDNGGSMTYDAEIDWGAGTLLVDYYPFQGTFHLTGGLAFSGNGVDLTGKPTAGTYTLNGNTYSADDIGSIRGEAEWGGTAPYLGVGWGRAVAKEGHFSFNFDLGVMFAGSPDVSLSATCNVDPTTCAQLQSDLDAEEKDAEDEVSDYDLIPVLNFTLGYRF